MPFGRHSGFSFSTVSVRQNAPACSGVYGLSNSRGWVYVGIADDIQAALLGHLSEPDSTSNSNEATGFTFEPCEASRRTERQNRLITELRPLANYRTA